LAWIARLLGRVGGIAPPPLRQAENQPRCRPGRRMRMRRGRVVVAALGSLLWLSGCETTTKLGDAFQSSSSKVSDFFQSKSADDPQSTATVPASPDPLTTGSANARLPDGPPPGTPPGVFGSDVYDDLNMGKKFYRTGNFGMAERSFRRAVETHPK